MGRGWAIFWENRIRVAIANPMPLALVAFEPHHSACSLKGGSMEPLNPCENKIFITEKKVFKQSC